MSAVTLELWQTEWCPASHRVRQRLTELGLSYTVHQVPVEHDDRIEVEEATGRRTIPILVAAGEVIDGEQAILTYLEDRYTEPREAAMQRAKAAKAKKRELEEACPRLAAGTH